MFLAIGVLLVTALLLVPVRPLLGSAGAIDVPNERSSHTAPTVRGAGVVGAPALAGGVLFGSLGGKHSVALALSVLALTVLGFLDDIRSRSGGVSWKARLAVQTAIATWLCAHGLRLDVIDCGTPPGIALGSAAWPLTVLWLVAMTNAFNFIDGLDGMAALQAIAIGVGGWVLLGRAGPAEIFLLLAAVGFGFLPHNVPRARLFLGDSGSLPLGFTIAAACVAGKDRAGASVFLPLSLLAAPIVIDTGTTLLSRVARGRNIAEAHRDHLYQRVQAAGWSHMGVSGVYAVATAVCFAAAASWPSRPGLTPLTWLALGVFCAVARRGLARRALAK